MTLDEARKLVEPMLGDRIWPRNTDLRDGRLLDGELTLDGRFSADELEAIAIVMRADRDAQRRSAVRNK